MRAWVCIAMLSAACLCGCALWHSPPAEAIPAPPSPVVNSPSAKSQGVMYSPPWEPSTPPSVLPNPLPVPVVDLDFAWEQIAAVVEEYFKIQHEERVRLVGGILTEGRIDTVPLTASTLLEPWRRDSVTFRDRLLATLQSMRRRAFIRVIPIQSGFLVDLQIEKDLEDLPKPTMDLNGRSTFDQIQGVDRLSNPLPSLATPPGAPLQPAVPTAGWINVGRDVALEQVMLSKIQTRLAPFAAPAYTAPGGNFGIPPGK